MADSVSKNWEINTKDQKCSAFTDDEEKVWKAPYYFVQGADTQFGLISRYVLKQEVIDWEQEKKLAEDIVVQINKMDPPPRFFVICGDLCDAVDDPLRELQEKDFKRIFGKVKKEIPVLCVCGNHDMGDTPTKALVERYRSTYGNDYYSFFCGGVLYMVLNSQFFADGSKVQQIAKEHADWIDNTLENAKQNSVKRIILFQHIPWFLKNVDEEGDPYFTLKKELRDVWLPKFKSAGVKAIFCGHWHGNSFGSYQGLDVITTSAIGAQLRGDKSGARIVKILEDSIEHEYYAIDDLPAKPLL